MPSDEVLTWSPTGDNSLVGLIRPPQKGHAESSSSGALGTRDGLKLGILKLLAISVVQRTKPRRWRSLLPEPNWFRFPRYGWSPSTKTDRCSFFWISEGPNMNPISQKNEQVPIGVLECFGCHMSST